MGRRRVKFCVVLSATLAVLLFVLHKLVLGPNPATSRYNSFVGKVVNDSISKELRDFQSSLRRLGNHNRSNHGIGSANKTSTHLNKSNQTTHQHLKLDFKAKSTTSVKLQNAGKYFSEPIDPHTYSYIHNPSMTCFHENGSKASVCLLFVVLTAPGNFQRREAIRRSYGNATAWPIIDSAGTKTVFLLGTTADNGVRKAIDKEARTYGDIVQEDFIDSYLNLTRKTVMGLKWATNNCHHALYVMKIDDDTTVNQNRLIEIVKYAPRVNFSLGYVWKGAFVNRNTKSKFYISPEYYPDDKFPPYINGPGYIMSADIVESVYHTASTIPLFPWEDVFIGMCLQKLDVELGHDNEFLFGGNASLIAQRKVRCPEKYAIFTDTRQNEVWQIFDACRE